MSRFTRFSIGVNVLELQTVIGAGQFWLEQSLTGIGSLPLAQVPALEPLRKCIVRFDGQQQRRREAGYSSKRKKEVKISLTPAEAAAIMLCLPEDLLGPEYQLLLRCVHGKLQQQLLNFNCIRL